jgi:hypothetical protein
MTAEQPIDLVTCPECRAANATAARRCWLCGRDFTGKGPQPPPLPPMPAGEAPYAPGPEQGAATFGASTALLLVTLVILGVGIFSLAPGMGVLYVILVAPPVIATSLVGARRRQRGQAWGGKEKAATAAISIVGLFSALGLLSLAAFVAFFVYCVVAIANS